MMIPIPAHAPETACPHCGAAIVIVATGDGSTPLDLSTRTFRGGVLVALAHPVPCPARAGWGVQYRGPTGNVDDPESAELVARYQALKAEGQP